MNNYIIKQSKYLSSCQYGKDIDIIKLKYSQA